jgi:CRISPR-associated protein Cas1
VREGVERLDTSAKRRLALILHADFATEEGVTPLSTVLSRLAASLAQVFLGERKSLALPISPIPIEPSTNPADEPELQ